MFEAETKPVVCKIDRGQNLSEGFIYYRYPGETKHIKYAELLEMLRTSNQEGQAWHALISSAQSSGIENVALLDLESGKVTGQKGKFFIEEKHLPKLKFVNEGKLSDTEGAPTLRVIGDLTPAVISDAATHHVDFITITDDATFEAFLRRQEVSAPIKFIEHAVQSYKKWVPLFYFMRLAKMSEAEAVDCFRRMETT